MSGSTLPSKEPIEISAVIEKATGVIDQAGGMITDVQGKLNIAMDTATATINNVNGLVSQARNGKGPIGALLNDQQSAARLKVTVPNAQMVSARIDQITAQAAGLVTDVESRNLPAKLDDTITSARCAAQQLSQASATVNSTLNDALSPDRPGEDAAANIRESLSNVNLATADIANDTEALKHGFLFRGYFKKRGFYSLQDFSPEQYRNNAFFQNPANRRYWLDAGDAFTEDGTSERLTPAGKEEIDQVIGTLKDNIVNQPIVIEGYSSRTPPEDQLLESRSRASLVAHYLEKRFHLRQQDIGVMALNAAPPRASGKPSERRRHRGACRQVREGAYAPLERWHISATPAADCKEDIHVE